MQMLRLWFSLSVDVGRVAYAASGFGLMVVKYAVEAALIWHYTGRYFAAHNFLNPLLSMRQEFFQPPAPDWLQWVLFSWTLPFLWIVVSMSVRRTLARALWWVCWCLCRCSITSRWRFCARCRLERNLPGQSRG